MRGVVAALLSAVCTAALAQSPPPDSIYLLPMPLTDQSAKETRLDRYRGQPVLVSMFYGSCPHVCPMLISTVQRMERELTPTQRKKLRVLMVSIDPERDTPPKLAELAERHHADLSRWTFARASEPDVRKLAALLNIQYRRLPDGDYNHATVITLLDAEGRIAATTSSLLRLDADFLRQLGAATAP